MACFQWCRSPRSNCAYRSVLLSRQRSQCPLPLLLFARGRVVRRGSARCTQCLRASRSTSLYPAARLLARPPYYHCKSSLISRSGDAPRSRSKLAHTEPICDTSSWCTAFSALVPLPRIRRSDRLLPRATVLQEVLQLRNKGRRFSGHLPDHPIYLVDPDLYP